MQKIFQRELFYHESTFLPHSEKVTTNLPFFLENGLRRLVHGHIFTMETTGGFKGPEKNAFTNFLKSVLNGRNRNLLNP